MGEGTRGTSSSHTEYLCRLTYVSERPSYIRIGVSCECTVPKRNRFLVADNIIYFYIAAVEIVLDREQHLSPGENKNGK